MRFLDPIKSRINLMISRAVLTALNDTASHQYVQLSALKNELKDGVELIQPYGFKCNPLSGSQLLLLCVGGNRSHPMALSAGDKRHRPKGGEDGESGLWHFEGDQIRLLKGNLIEITTNNLVIKASEKVRIETPLLEVTGEIKDLCDTDGKTLRSMRETFDIHTHPENDSGGPTDQPNQLMGG